MTEPNRDNQFLADWLADRDEPCPACGYSLLACTANNCPECGTPLKLAVSMEDPSPGGWLLAVIACALAAGFDLVASVIFVVGMSFILIVEGIPPGMPWGFLAAMLATILVPGVLCVIGLVLLLRKRKRWRVAPPRVRWNRGIAVFAIVLITHLVIGAFWFSRMLAQ